MNKLKKKGSIIFFSICFLFAILTTGLVIYAENFAEALRQPTMGLVC